mmetsp:Transcript_27066/g.87447  ORF Transcript_27066/g.87447 Transcript_27066/m.87447 type:complete len:284 (+) Transcript_27066:1502-2353(+)
MLNVRTKPSRQLALDVSMHPGSNIVGIGAVGLGGHIISGSRRIAAPRASRIAHPIRTSRRVRAVSVEEPRNMLRFGGWRWLERLRTCCRRDLQCRCGAYGGHPPEAAWDEWAWPGFRIDDEPTRLHPCILRADRTANDDTAVFGKLLDSKLRRERAGRKEACTAEAVRRRRAVRAELPKKRDRVRLKLRRRVQQLACIATWAPTLGIGTHQQSSRILHRIAAPVVLAMHEAAVDTEAAARARGDVFTSGRLVPRAENQKRRQLPRCWLATFSTSFLDQCQWLR